MFLVKKQKSQESAQPHNILNHNPIYRAASCLQKYGYCLEDCRLALLALIVMNSAVLGHSVTMVVKDAYGRMADLLGHIFKMVPENRVYQALDLSKDLIFHRNQPFRNRCVILNNDKSLSKYANYLNALLRQGYATIQEQYKSKYGSGMEELRAEGPVSCILLKKDNRECVLNNPYIINVNTSSVEPCRALSTPTGRLHLDNDLLDVEAATIRYILEWVPQQRVDVSLSAVPGECELEHSAHIESLHGETILRLISTIAVLNNMSMPSDAEQKARSLNVDVNKIIKWQSQHSESTAAKLLTAGDHLSYTEPRYITATKVDYYIFWVLANELINAGDGQLTNRQRIIFEALKDLNVQLVQSNTFSNTTSNTSAQISISRSSSAWANREMILKAVNANSSPADDFSMQELLMELKKLTDFGHIAKDKIDGKRGNFYYVLNMNKTTETFELPHPSIIFDPVYQGKEIQLLNPITNTIDII